VIFFTKITHSENTIKFVRRPDLDTQTRINLVVQALANQGIYGARTTIAAQHHISRTFLYQLINMTLLCLHELFSAHRLEVPDQLDLNSTIALLRLEGRVSIAAISEILHKLDYPHNSTGMIGERLKAFGGCLSNTLNVDTECLVFFLSDEIFALSRPILVTIDPVSTAILRIEIAPNRNAITWELHYQALKDNLIMAKGLGSDRAESINKGVQAVFDNLVWCSDHFHEFRDLVKLLATLEKQAYAAIAEEEERFRVFDNAKSESNLQKRLEQYETAQADCNQKIAQYQHVSDMLDLLFPSLYFFDQATGRHHTEQHVKGNLLILMDWLDELQLPKLQQETQSIRNHIDDICACYRQVEEICNELAKTLPEDVLNFMGLAWQHGHQSHQHKGACKKYHVTEQDFLLDVVKSLLDDNAEIQIAQAFEMFDGMVRSSSLIEMVNSQIRPHLNNSKGLITQELLNLIMFYHNHHLYKSGKRKGKAPIEIFTGTKLEGTWLDRLFETIAQSQQ
jgi:hypothetical protein